MRFQGKYPCTLIMVILALVTAIKKPAFAVDRSGAGGDKVLTWRELLDTAEKILVVEIPENQQGGEKVIFTAGVVRDLRAEAAGKASPVGETVKLRFDSAPPPTGRYLAFLSEHVAREPEVWRVFKNQTFYAEDFAGPVLKSLEDPSKLQPDRYLSADDRYRASSLLTDTSSSVQGDEVPSQQGGARELRLQIEVKRDKFDSPGHARLLYILENCGKDPVAVYDGVGAEWLLEISNGGLETSRKVRPGCDEEMMALHLDIQLIAMPSQFRIIPAGKKYVHEVFLTPAEFPFLAELKGAVRLVGGYRNKISRLSPYSSPTEAEGFPSIWTGTVTSEPFTAELHSDKQKEHLDKVGSGKAEKLQYRGIEDLDIPKNVNPDQFTPPNDTQADEGSEAVKSGVGEKRVKPRENATKENGDGQEVNGRDALNGGTGDAAGE